MMLIDRIIKFRWYLIALLLLGGYGLVNGSVVYASEFTHSQALPSSDPNYRVELIDPPSDGYALYGDIPMRVHVNNNTGRELKNFRIQYVIKKDVTSTGDLKGINFSDYLEFKNLPSVYRLGFEIDNTYLAPTLTRNILPQLTEDFNTILNYRIKDRFINVANYGKLNPSWLVDGDTEIKVRFLSDDVVLAEQVLQLKKQNTKPDYRLRVTKFKNTYSELSKNDYITITNEASRYAWLQVVPVNKGLKPIPQHPARFTFHLPDGVSFVKAEWDKIYPSVPVEVSGQDISIELPPYLVGNGWVYYSAWFQRLIDFYLRIPIKFEGDVRSEYQFTVDSEDIQGIQPYNLDNTLIRQLDSLELVKDTNDSTLRLDKGDYVTINAELSNPALDIQGAKFSKLQKGLLLKQFSLSEVTPTTKVYGIRADGLKVEIQPVLRDLNSVPYYEKRYSGRKYVYKGLDDYEEIEVDYGNNRDNSQIALTYEITDKNNLPRQLPITYRVDGRDKTVNVNVTYEESKFLGDLTRYNTNFVNQSKGSLYYLSTLSTNLIRTPYEGRYQGYVIYKYEKGMTLQHTRYEELVKREIVGDYIYDLTKIVKYGTEASSIEAQQADFSPVFQDGAHRMTGKIFFNHDNSLPDSIADITVRGHYDENRSLQDNYDSTSNKEYVIDFTYQSPRSLQVAALINGTTDINVVNTDDVYTFEHYLMNKSNQSYSNVEGEVTLPKSVVLTELVTTDSRYKVLYKVGDSWVENPANLEDVTDFKVVPKVEGTSLGVQDVVKTTAKIKVKDVVYDGKLVIDSKMTVNGASTKAQDVVLNIKDVKLADGTLKIQYVNINGDLLKETISQGRHGTAYEVNVLDFEKDGKNYGYDHVDGNLNGSYEGTKTKVVKVYMKEKPRVYELPVSGKLDFIWILFSLVGILAITGKHKKIKV